MRIAQVAPLIESVPPRAYGGTERVVHYLTEALVAMGHEVTLFASGDSSTSARLVPIVDRALRLHPAKPDQVIWHTLLVDRVREMCDEFDVIHFHVDTVHLPVAVHCRTPSLTTLHGRLDLPDLSPLFKRFAQHPLVSISDSQRRPLAWANWLATVPHGLPPISTSSIPRLRTTSRSSAASRPKRAATARSRSRSPATCHCASPPMWTCMTRPTSK